MRWSGGLLPAEMVCFTRVFSGLLGTCVTSRSVTRKGTRCTSRGTLGRPGLEWRSPTNGVQDADRWTRRLTMFVFLLGVQFAEGVLSNVPEKRSANPFHHAQNIEITWGGVMHNMVA